MIQLKARRIWQTRRRYPVLVLVCLCALTFVAGCNGGKATGASTPAPAASPAVNTTNGQSATTPAAATTPTIAQTVSGKKYVNSAGDTIEFRSNGKAIERNARPGMLYPHQGADVDANGIPSTACTYTLTGNKLFLTCDEGVKAVFTITNDGSLTGPKTGMYNHPAFAHFVEKK